MATIIRMPSVLAGSEEAAIASWLIEKGQIVSVGDPLAEIETEKAVVEYNSEDAGIVGRVLLSPGESGEIGAPIAVLISEDETDSDIDEVLGSSGGADAAASASAEQFISAEPDVIGSRDPESATPVAEVASIVAGSSERPTVVSDSTRLFVSPIARKLARESGIEPASLRGSGPKGRIVRRDVEQAVKAGSTASAAADALQGESAPFAAPTTPTPTTLRPAPAPAAASGATGGHDLIPHTGMRKAIARRLTESKSTVPHFYLTTECKVDDLIALRAEVNARSSTRVSINDFVVKAVASAFADVPEANVTWSDEGMRAHHAVDIAVAVATEGGLVTPVVRGVDSKSLTAVSSSIAELVGRAKDKKLKQDELEGGSFSVSNLGMYGTVEFSAILNPPQSGILAVGAARPQAVVIDGEIVVATVMRCTLSVDHRAVDGALAARWLAAFSAHIENPLSILL